MNDQLEIGLEDDQLLAEIQLVTDLMIAAVESAGGLDQAAIDRILGVNLFPRQRCGGGIR